MGDKNLDEGDLPSQICDETFNEQEVQISQKNSFRRKLLLYESQIKDNTFKPDSNGSHTVPRGKFRSEIQIRVTESNRIRATMNEDNKEVKSIQEQQVGEANEELLDSKYTKNGRDTLPQHPVGTDAHFTSMPKERISTLLTSAEVSTLNDVSQKHLTRSAFLNQLINDDNHSFPSTGDFQVIKSLNREGGGIAIKDPSPVGGSCMQSSIKRFVRKKPRIPENLFKSHVNKNEEITANNPQPILNLLSFRVKGFALKRSESLFSKREEHSCKSCSSIDSGLVPVKSTTKLGGKTNGETLSSGPKIPPSRPPRVRHSGDKMRKSPDCFKMNDGDGALSYPFENKVKTKPPIDRSHSSPLSTDHRSKPSPHHLWNSRETKYCQLLHPSFSFKVRSDHKTNECKLSSIKVPLLTSNLSIYTATVTTSQKNYCSVPFFLSLQDLKSGNELSILSQNSMRKSRSANCLICKLERKRSFVVAKADHRNEDVGSQKSGVYAVNKMTSTKLNKETHLDKDSLASEQLTIRKKVGKKTSAGMSLMNLKNSKENSNKNKHRLFRKFSSDSSVYPIPKSETNKLSPKEKLINFKVRSRNFIKERLKAERKCFSADPQLEYSYDGPTSVDLDKCATLPSSIKNKTKKLTDIEDINNESLCPVQNEINRQSSHEEYKYEYIDSTDEFSVSDASFSSKEKKNALQRESSIQEEENLSSKVDKSASNLPYFRESHIDSATIKKERIKNFEKRAGAMRSIVSRSVVSQTSSDSDGPEDFNSPQQRRFLQTPSLLFDQHETDSSYQDFLSLNEFPNGYRYSSSRNVSPSPYACDSDSGERYSPRSPFEARRYSKRPLRGPYGEMLEAEMSKSKSTSQFLNEETFLRPRESQSAPRPTSPVSPTSLYSESNFLPSPMILVPDEGSLYSSSIPASRSLDDSTLMLYYSSTKSQNQEEPLNNLSTPSNETDNSSLLLFPAGPFHQRTASSPSKLYFEPSVTNESLISSNALDEATKNNKVIETRSKVIGSPNSVKNKPDRKTKHSKASKVQEDIARLSGVPKKTVVDKEFRSLTEPRHIHRRHRDTRAHIIGEIYDTEKNYVDNLNFLLKRYRDHLQSTESIIEPALCDDIFFQVPEIYSHHKQFLEELQKRMEPRDTNLCVGDLLLQMLKDPSVLESYKSFVNNWKSAQEAAKEAAHAKPTFRHFLGAMAKEHPGKLDLKALLITPVQRFPHYELILKRLFDHTSGDHPDFEVLKEAILEIQKVATSINAIEQEALQLEQQQFILKEIENFIEGLTGLVQPDRKFLQLEQVTQNSGLGIRKERCLFLFSDILVITSIKRRSATMRKNSSLQLALLSSLESCKLKLLKFISLDDLEIGRSRDDSIKRLVKESEALEQDLQTLFQISQLAKTLHFPKGNFDEALQDLDNSLRKQLIDRQGADSQLSELELNITTQEGIETLTFMLSSADRRNKWEEEFNSAKQKLAISANRRPPPEFVCALPIRKTRAGLQFTCASPTLGLNAHNLKDVWVCNSDGYVGQVCVMSLQPEPALACCNGVCNARILSIASIPSAPHPDSSDEDEEEDLFLNDDKRRSGSLPPDISSDENESQQPTMWLGTEDGYIHVYNCNDTIRTKRNKFKFQPGSPVQCIIHIENRVFASLANGDVVVYERDSQGSWSTGKRHVVSLSTAAAPVTKMVVATGKLWCSASNAITVLQTNSLEIEHTFTVGGENGKGVACMVSAGHGVWIAMHSSATIRLYQATTHDCVTELTVTSAVTKMLSGCDDIIRQHKLACLKVTSLLACKDLLWVGTSAGVIITLPLPHLSRNSRRLQSPINMDGISHGHTGNVRFLTSVEMTPESSRLKTHTRYSLKGKDHAHHQPGTAAPSKLLVISGGDGYEDFRNSGLSEMAGRDDSTNHLLLWQV